MGNSTSQTPLSRMLLHYPKCNIFSYLLVSTF